MEIRNFLLIFVTVLKIVLVKSEKQYEDEKGGLLWDGLFLRPIDPLVKMFNFLISLIKLYYKKISQID